MKVILICVLASFYSPLLAQPANTHTGVVIITSGGGAADSLFINLVNDSNAKVIFIPTAASSLRSDSGVIWNPDDEKNKEEFKHELLKRFRLSAITILHTRDRRVANAESFVRPLRDAKAVWISSGNPGRFMSVYKGTRLEKELRLLLQRGGIIGGESAGAIVQGSYIVRGNPAKPVLMVKGNERGLGLLQDVAIDPHLSAQKRENELVTVVDRYPKVLGIGIDDDTGLIIRDGIGEVFGDGRVAIFDNRKHRDGWFYWLKPGNKFDFNKRLPIDLSPE